MSETVIKNTPNDAEENKFVFVPLQAEASEHISAPNYSYWRSVFRRFFASKVAIVMLVISALIIIMSIIQPMFSGYDAGAVPDTINDFSTHFNWPSAKYWFGTDKVGNSLFDVVWAGTRTSLMIAFVSTAITTVLGVIVGAFWGYSKKADVVLLEVYNVIYNIPYTLFVLVMMYILGRGVGTLIFTLSCTSWLGTAYFIRVQVMIIRDREYNLASRCLGTSTWNILKHNIMPFLVSVIVTTVSRDLPSFISYEVFLSYLGIGLTQDTASLGRMIQDYAQYMQSSWYLFWIPVAISALISVSLYVVGQTLADASDPKTHMI
jgi:oligopeptide transport system permease protein